MTENEPDTLDPSGLWLTITELSEAKGLGKSAVGERVARLEGQGLLTTRPGPRKTKLVNLAEYDRIVGQVADLAREQGHATRRGEEPGAGPDESGGAIYTREQARRMSYQAELSRLELEERLKKLVSVDALSEGVGQAGAAIRRAIERLPQFDDDIRAACERPEPNELTILLKRIANRMCSEAADTLQAILTEGQQEGGDEAA